MEKEWPSHKWTSDDPVRSFMETLKKRALERYSAVKYLIPLLLNLNKMFSFKKKSKKPTWWTESKRLLEKPCNMKSKV